jgi:hypothetical protein
MTNFIILFWDMGCPIRNQNTKISWMELKKLTDYLKSKNLDVNCFLFEFGKKFLFEDSIKIDLELEYYERSKKINIALKHEVNDNSKLFALMDSDLFFGPDQYDDIGKDILFLLTNKESCFHTYNLLDIEEKNRKLILNSETETINFEKLNSVKNSLIWRHSWGSGTLGGFFIAPTEKLRSIGGFDEKYITWGAEDDDALTRLKSNSNCIWFPKKDVGPYHLYHPKNTKDEKYYIQVYTEKYFKINKVNKPY